MLTRRKESNEQNNHNDALYEIQMETEQISNKATINTIYYTRSMSDSRLQVGLKRSSGRMQSASVSIDVESLTANYAKMRQTQHKQKQENIIHV